MASLALFARVIEAVMATAAKSRSSARFSRWCWPLLRARCLKRPPHAPRPSGAEEQQCGAACFTAVLVRARDETPTRAAERKERRGRDGAWDGPKVVQGLRCKLNPLLPFLRSPRVSGFGKHSARSKSRAAGLLFCGGRHGSTIFHRPKACWQRAPPAHCVRSPRNKPLWGLSVRCARIFCGRAGAAI